MGECSRDFSSTRTLRHILPASGQTRPASTTTEAESYLRVALNSGLIPPEGLPFLRATTEDHALDSFQNLVFSIARFHEYTGNYPTKITVVGYEMKRHRFTELHRAALRWPQSRFQYIGIDAESETTTIAQQGEVCRSFDIQSAERFTLECFIATEWIPPVYPGYVRLSRHSTIQTPV